MAEKNYSKREIDALHDSIHEKLDLLIKEVRFTNGKVKKIILALVVLFGILIGSGAKNIPAILSIIL